MTLEERVEALEKEVEELKMQLKSIGLALICINSSTANNFAVLSEAISRDRK